MDFRRSLRNARQMSVESAASPGCCAYVTMAGAFCTLILMVLLGIAIFGVGIAKLVMGGLYFEDCPLEPLLPIWLIVDACVAFLLGCRCSGKSEDGEEGEGIMTKILKGIVGLFQLAWLICGTLWVLNVRDQIYSPDHCIDADIINNSTLMAPSSNSSIILSAITTSLAPVTAECLTCASALVDFVFGIIIFQWALIGLVVLTLCCVCAGVVVSAFG